MPGLPDEFELIARYFAPLARAFPGAYGLRDDAAVISPAPDCEESRHPTGKGKYV